MIFMCSQGGELLILSKLYFTDRKTEAQWGTPGHVLRSLRWSLVELELEPQGPDYPFSTLSLWMTDCSCPMKSWKDFQKVLLDFGMELGGGVLAKEEQGWGQQPGFWKGRTSNGTNRNCATNTSYRHQFLMRVILSVSEHTQFIVFQSLSYVKEKGCPLTFETKKLWPRDSTQLSFSRKPSCNRGHATLPYVAKLVPDT